MSNSPTYSALPADYNERVYAGVLGKIIGVYLGRPFEGWPHEKIVAELGEVWYYVNDRLMHPLVVTDDDISGTFTFLRALEDYKYDPSLSPKQIGQTWLNYIIENRTILWWGGMGNSTEHTAFLRLKNGTEAPASGSIAMNGQVVAEQIGAQIFIDGWGLIHPGDPKSAADFAARAASVSHDGAAIHGAKVVAAMVAQAFVEAEINKVIDAGLSVIPADCLIATMIQDIRAWHAKGLDWRSGFQEIKAKYGYDKFGGNCHMVPNHALIIHALLHGEGDFQRSLMIVNTCGWDTDCNSANVGCIVGVLNGLKGIDAGPDWRGPVSDRILIPTADGGRCVTDAVIEAHHVINAGRMLRGLPAEHPKSGARFHFEFPGSVQGFEVSHQPGNIENVRVFNTEGHSESGNRSLAIQFSYLAPGVQATVSTRTFPNAEDRKMTGYGLYAAPTLYPGQVVTARIEADPANPQPTTVSLGLFVGRSDDKAEWQGGPTFEFAPGSVQAVKWIVPDGDGYPIEAIGLQLKSEKPTHGTVYLDFLGWQGTPTVTFKHTKTGNVWRQQWVNGVSELEAWSPHIKVIQNEGTGLLITGTREWQDVTVESNLCIHLAKSAGIAVRVQGMRRYYALLVYRDGFARIVRSLDGETVLAETPHPWTYGETPTFRLQVKGNKLIGTIDGKTVLTATDDALSTGGIALVIEEGRLETHSVQVHP